MPDHVRYRERFEFSAAHRLHVATRDDEWNRSFYGKCNNPAGHGHNYELEVVVRSTLDAVGTPTPDPAAIARLVDETVIERWDHRHLNEDVEDFRDRVPSVEHIALRARDLLEPIVDRAGGRLEELTVWETGKTSCTVRYSGDD